MDSLKAVGAIILLILAKLGFDAYKTDQALDAYDKAKQDAEKMKDKVDVNKHALDILAEAREEGRNELQAKLDREVTDEEVNDFLTNRYRNS